MYPTPAATTPIPCQECTSFFYQNSTLLCSEFFRLVELLSDTVFLLNFHFFEGRKENLHQFTQGGGRGPKAL